MTDFKGRIGRRSMLKAEAVSLAGLPALASAASQNRNLDTIDPDAGVTAPEDLMREHGVLNRCLLIYEEAARRSRDKEAVSAEVFNQTADLIRSFVEEYHERNEEKYIFPVFEAHKKLLGLVRTVKTQHQAGRDLTVRILHLSTPGQFRSPDSRTQWITCRQSFIRMCRPHQSREDTVLFPALRTLLAPDQWTRLATKWRRTNTRFWARRAAKRAQTRWQGSKWRLAYTTSRSSHRKRNR